MLNFQIMESVLMSIRPIKNVGLISTRIAGTDGVSFEKVLLEKGNHATFQLQDTSGELQTIPFHRVREVYKDEALFWSRLH